MEPTNSTLTTLLAVVGIGTPVLSLLTGIIGNYLTGQIRSARLETLMEARTVAQNDTIRALTERIKSLEDLVHSLLIAMGDSKR
jgi:hypothetical protein